MPHVVAPRRPFVASSALLLLAVCAALPAAAAPTLAELAVAVESPRVGGEVAPAPLALGRGVVTPAAGTSVRLLTAGGEAVGLLVDGPATLRYTVEDPLSVPVAKRNAKRIGGIRARADGERLVMEDTLRSAVVWSRALAAAGPAPAAAGEGGELPAWALEVLAGGLFPHPAAALAEERGIAGAAGAVYALLQGSEGELLLQVDPSIRRHESLAALRRLPFATGFFVGKRMSHALADQPVGRAWWDATEPPLLAVHEALAVDNPAAEKVVVTSRLRLRARRDGVSAWCADLDSFVADERRVTEIAVLSVKVGGEPAPWFHRHDALVVDLGRLLARDQEIEVEVVHAGDLATRPNNDNYWMLSTWAWYPRAGWNGQSATLELTVRVPEPLVPLASGTTVARRKENGYNVLETRLDRPVQFPVVTAGKYRLYEEEREGRRVTVASYVFGKEQEARRLANLFFGAAATLETMLSSPYPFSEVDVVEINDWGWGQAPPGVIFITQEAYNPLSSEMSRLYSQGVNGRYVHEVAHAWWGHVIKTSRPEEHWLMESFADYTAAVALAAMRGGREGQAEFKQTLREWKSHTARIGDGGSVYLADYLGATDEEGMTHRRWLLYDKGPLVLHALRQELARQVGSDEEGDVYFFALLRSFVTNFPFQFGETRHLVGILNQMTGSDWQPWFERYVYGTETPPVEIR